MENPQPLSGKHIVGPNKAFFIPAAFRLTTRSVRHAHDDRVACNNGSGVQTDVAIHRIHLLIHFLLQINNAVFAEPGNGPADLCVQRDHVVARSDINDSFLRAVGPVSETTPRQLSRRGLTALPFVVRVLPKKFSSGCVQRNDARRVPAVEYKTPFTMRGVDWKLNSGRGPRLSVLKRQAT